MKGVEFDGFKEYTIAMLNIDFKKHTMSEIDLNERQQQVYEHLMQEFERVEQLPKEQRFKASNQLSHDFDALVPPIQRLRIFRHYWRNRL